MYKKSEERKDLEYYLALPYPLHLSKESQEGEEYWLAEVLDLPGCMAHGSTPDEAVENAEDAKRAWIEAHLEDGYEVPEPADARGYSGKLLLRLPKSLHRKLARDAQRENVSLNQLIVSRLAGAIGSDALATRQLGERIARLTDVVEAAYRQVRDMEHVRRYLQAFVTSQQAMSMGISFTTEDPSGSHIVFTGEPNWADTQTMEDLLRHALESSPADNLLTGTCRFYSGLAEPYLRSIVKPQPSESKT